MSENLEKKPLTPEQKENNSYSFIVGMVIALVIIVLFAVLFNR